MSSSKLATNAQLTLCIPVWFPDPPPNESIEIEEGKDVRNTVVLKVNARDDDVGEENKRVSYFFKLNNQNVPRTNEFVVDENTGEVRPLRYEIIQRFWLVVISKYQGG